MQREWEFQKFRRVFDAQSDESRAAILAFFHLVEDPAHLRVEFEIESAGCMKLLLEVPVETRGNQ